MATKDYTDAELDKVENNIVDALMEAASFRTSEDNRRPINIKRNGKSLEPVFINA